MDETARSKRPTRPATTLVHGGTMRSQFGETSEALFLTQGFVYDTAEAAEARFKGEEPGFVYSRYSNPTTRMFEERMIALEGAGDARATASGMAAVWSALQCQLKAGDHVVSARALFGSCRYVVETVLGRAGIASTFVDGRDLDAWRAAVRPETKVFFAETPTNPTLELVDIAGISQLARDVGARVVIDNVFATPLLQKPLELGADVVVYSATKHIDGQGRCLGGVVLSSQEWVDEFLADFFRHTGPSLSPFNAWTFLKGLETLPLRVAQQTRSAAALADRLAELPGIARVLYPGRDDHPDAALARRQMKGGSTLLAFELQGGKEAAFRFANALEVIKISNNLGDSKSLVTHPATTTHKNLAPEVRAELGISDGLLRLSVGLEDEDDLLDDVTFATKAAAR
ncbi:O-succinylhomoserine sulfhydrylase [Antarcticirhabdus aurantiaca]|uniref:O-succinylhomoserine sulfhydrylase n=1 Tax=Antarcticirhabdus aurantiaca TaxID=2606717 RepID=A0ACD4NJV3_9HYPH|nr:O-succinylhomoserine sulfhydrylase [Antarcticirhabdus aurantiaca]WAJ27088.1 O-succinylhomoserine sulfhydrylase [Jeongeuplla avenae]